MRRLISALLILLLACGPAFADLREAVNALGKAKLDGMEQAIKAVAAEPGDAKQKVLDALGEGSLYIAPRAVTCLKPPPPRRWERKD